MEWEGGMVRTVGCKRIERKVENHKVLSQFKKLPPLGFQCGLLHGTLVHSYHQLLLLPFLHWAGHHNLLLLRPSWQQAELALQVRLDWGRGGGGGGGRGGGGWRRK